MAYSRLSHKGGAVQNTLDSQLLDNGQTISLSSTPIGWPAAGAPFFVVIDPGTAKEEKVCVVYVSGTTLNVVDETDYTDPWDTSVNGRGVDDTTAYQHEAGAVIYPVFTAREADQANELVASYTANGDIVVHGSTSFKKIAVGTNAHVLQADSTITDGGVKWGQVVTGGITDGAVTEAKLATDSVTATKIAAGAVGASELASSAVETAKINDSAVTTAKINDAAVTAAKLASNAVETAKINDAAVTSAKLDSAVIQLLAPTGSVTQYAGASAPTGWLMCDGSEVAIASYTSLYNILTSTGAVFPYGANTNGSGGAGSTHFRLPNFKGRVPVGRDASQTEFDTLGETGGAKTHTLTTAEMPAHKHDIDTFSSNGGHQHTAQNAGGHSHTIQVKDSSNQTHSHTLQNNVAAGTAGTDYDNTLSIYAVGDHQHTTDTQGSHQHTVTLNNTGGGGAHNNLQPYLTINYIVKT